MASLPNVAIIELGSQYTLLIERTLRELGVRSVILDSRNAASWLKKNPLKAVILSGGASSVYNSDAPQPPAEVLSLMRQDGQPIALLGICYGMQWLAHRLGGEVKAVLGNREYGEAEINLDERGHLFFADTPRRQRVWMSHGDSVISVPEGFSILGHTDTGTIAAMARGAMLGVQFHSGDQRSSVFPRRSIPSRSDPYAIRQDNAHEFLATCRMRERLDAVLDNFFDSGRCVGSTSKRTGNLRLQRRR